MSAHAASTLKPHIKLAPDARFQRAIVCGAPERAALIASGTAAEGQREVELAKRLSSTYVEWESSPARAGTVPRGLERIKTDLDAWGMDRVQALLSAAEQRDQRDMLLDGCGHMVSVGQSPGTGLQLVTP